MAEPSQKKKEKGDDDLAKKYRKLKT